MNKSTQSSALLSVALWSRSSEYEVSWEVRREESVDSCKMVELSFSGRTGAGVISPEQEMQISSYFSQTNLAIQGRSIGSLLSVKIWSAEDCQIHYRRTGQIFSTENGALYVRTSWLYVFQFWNLRLAGDCHFSEILNYFSQFTIKGLQIFKIPSKQIVELRQTLGNLLKIL